MIAINPWMGVIGAVLTLVGVVVTARLTLRAQVTKTKSDERASAGALALSIATETREEFATYKAEQAARWAAVRTAWDRHADWDQAVLDELDQLDPGASRRLPKRTTLPLD